MPRGLTRLSSSLLAFVCFCFLFFFHLVHENGVFKSFIIDYLFVPNVCPDTITHFQSFNSGALKKTRTSYFRSYKIVDAGFLTIFAVFLFFIQKPDFRGFPGFNQNCHAVLTSKNALDPELYWGLLVTKKVLRLLFNNDIL